MGLCYGMKLTISSSSSSAASKTISSSSSSAASNSHGLLAGCNKKAFGDGNSSLTVFSFAELKEATKNFRADAQVGEGGFGYVYKGVLHGKQPSERTKTIIAVKRLKQSPAQAYREWLREIDFLGRLSHPNLVKLLGFCQEDENLALVYEYLPMGSLENQLFRKGSTAHLPWDVRLKVAVRAARGLAFLHSLERQIIFRDFKSSNIILDGSYTSKLSDFGLVKSGPREGTSHVSTRDENLALVYEFVPKGSLNNHLFRRGSTAHLPWDVSLKTAVGAARGLAFLHCSERKLIYRDFKTSNILLDVLHGQTHGLWIETGHLYVKSDVYGFGVVLLEILTGLTVLDQRRPAGRENLVGWVRSLLPSKRNLKTIMNSRLEGKYYTDCAFQIAQLALKCLQSTPNERPSMTEVVEELESIEDSNANRIPQDA
ncbi:hypothetical protein NL676_020357 [Syzygium grande]|nr:hypothetical protein NL676_020357 [Syzygium grande]